MSRLFDAPAFHKFADLGVLTRRRAEQLAMIHIGERLDIAHVKEDRDKLLFKRVSSDLMPRDGRDEFGRERTLLALVPLEDVSVRLKIHTVVLVCTAACSSNKLFVNPAAPDAL